ncbi:opioid growth factor receptor-like protein 1 isoform X1 [Electrophorus electricus]|nr:opioid growth factor receptor-like protein 1 isoform X1 [Electrophorus electricus]
MSKRYSKTDNLERDTSYCENKYDSTWEDEDDDTETSEINTRNTYAAKDMQNFRHRFREINFDDGSSSDEPDQEGSKLPNLKFYQNLEPSAPDGIYIKDYHENWFNNYKYLEQNHVYIQWLFPIQEQGMNFYAYPLTAKEIKLFCEDKDVKERLLKSYKLMLDFYGIKLVDEESGEVTRAENWEKQFENLNRNSHNNLRITRILKCLGILGFQHYQAPLVKFFLQETLVNRTLSRVKTSALDYFMFAVLDKSDRRKLIEFAFQTFEPKKEFVWCPKRIQIQFLNQKREHEAPRKSESKSNPNMKSQCQIRVSTPKIKWENTKASCSESETQTVHEASQSISPSHGVSKVQGEDELHRVTDQNSSNPVSTLSEYSADASGCIKGLSKKRSEEELSVQGECEISTLGIAKGDSERTSATQKSDGELTDTDTVQELDQTSAENAPDKNIHTELSGEESDLSPVPKNEEMSGKGMFNNQPTKQNLQDNSYETSGSDTADKKSALGRNGGNKHQGCEYLGMDGLPRCQMATGKANTNGTDKGTDDHSVCSFMFSDQFTKSSNTNNTGVLASGSVLLHNKGANSDQTSVKCEERDVPGGLMDKEDTQQSVNEHVRTPSSGDGVSEDDGGVRNGDTKGDTAANSYY